MTARVADLCNSRSKFIQRSGSHPKRKRNLLAFAEIKPLQSLLFRELRVLLQIFLYQTAQLPTQRRDFCIFSDVQRSQLFGEGVTVRIRQYPLREIIGKAFRQIMMGAQGLKGVMKNGGITALFQPLQKFRQVSRRYIADFRKVGHREEFELRRPRAHCRASSKRSSASVNSAGTQR